MHPTATTVPTGNGLLDAARTGDQRAFHTLVEPHGRELRAHCYRMLGSSHDADDALQDTLVRAWRGLAGFAGRSSLRTWLFTIATNVCLAAIERTPRRPLPVDLGPASDPRTGDWADGETVWLEPHPDHLLDDGPTSPAARYERRESVELAFVAAMQALPATQRAVLLLRDVLGMSAKETALALDTTTASVTSALQRSRGTLRRLLPERSQQATLRALGDRRLQAVVTAYVDAWERGDVDAIVAMLADDATFSMPPYPTWYRGRADIAAFLPGGPLREQWRLVPVRANGQIAFACFLWDAADRCYAAHSLDVVTLDGTRITHITAFLDDSVPSRFGLPRTLPVG
jgi:RNA polymerase sigma-70 factor (ECF subfamily)